MLNVHVVLFKSIVYIYFVVSLFARLLICSTIAGYKLTGECHAKISS